MLGYARKGSPGLMIPARRWAVGSEDLPDNRGSDLDGQDGEFTVDTAITPARILLSEPENEGVDAADGGRAPWSLRAGRSSVAALKQVAVPAQ